MRAEIVWAKKIHHMTTCRQGACSNLDFFFHRIPKSKKNPVYWMTETWNPEKGPNKLCYSLCLNKLCKCMWQVNIGGLWRRYSQPTHSAEPWWRGPNEDWTLIIRRIWLPHMRQSHSHKQCMCLINQPPFHHWATHTFSHLTRFSLSPGPLQVVHSVLVSSPLGFFCIALWRCRRSRGAGSYGHTAD